MLNTSQCVTRHSYFLPLDPPVQFFILVLLHLFAFLVFFIHSRYSLSDLQVVNTFSHSKLVFSLNKFPLLFRNFSTSWNAIWQLLAFCPELSAALLESSYLCPYLVVYVSVSGFRFYQQEQTKPQTLRQKEIIEIREQSDENKQTHQWRVWSGKKIDKIENH